MSKRLTDIQKKEIIQRFKNGESLDFLSDKFGYTKLTISRNIKKSIGSDLFNNLNRKNKHAKNKDNLSEVISKEDLAIPIKENNQPNMNPEKDLVNQSFCENQFFQESSFMELVPMDLDIDNTTRKNCSCIPIEEIDFPEIVYMIVDKKIELEIKVLRDYPEWQFLPEEDLQSKTIEIYFDLKVAKRDCKKDQKVIKVPNPNVFKIASKMIASRGISRIVSNKQLISL